MTRTTGGQALVRGLAAHGVLDFFGLPGVQSDFLYNAIYDEGFPFQVYTTRHEQGAAYMALGYAMSSHRVGVFSVVPGPGLLNASAALATAHSVGARVLCLSGQIPSASIGKGIGELHEIVDQPAMTAPITKWQDQADSPDAITPLLSEAFRQIDSDRPGPVKLEVPSDVLRDELIAEAYPTVFTPSRPNVDSADVSKAARIVAKASRPLIIVGGGALDSSTEVEELAERIGAPVAADRMGRGVLSARHPLSITPPVAHRLWAATDVVIAIGTRMHRPMAGWGTDADLQTVWINVDPEAATRVDDDPTVSIVARAEDTLPALIAQVPGGRPPRDDLDDARAAAEVQIGRLAPQIEWLRAIRSELADDDIFVQDLTQIGYVSRVAYPVYRPRTYLSPGYQGTLGWSFATALGAKVANPAQNVVAVTGDGGFLFTATELATAVHYGLGVVTIVFNNDAYGNVQMMQRDDHGGRVHATDLSNPDFVKFAESFGAQGLRATRPDDLRAALRTAFAYEGPTVIDVPLSDVPSPWEILYPGRIRGG